MSANATAVPASEPPTVHFEPAATASRPQTRRARWAWAAAGPLLFGAAWALPLGLHAVPQLAAALAAVIAATVALTLPTLCVILAYGRVGPSLGELGVRAAETLQSLGLVLAGLTPAMLFLAATTGPIGGLVAAMMLLAVAAMLALIGLSARLFPDGETPKTIALFAPWALLVLAIGLYLSSRFIIELMPQLEVL